MFFFISFFSFVIFVVLLSRYYVIPLLRYLVVPLFRYSVASSSLPDGKPALAAHFAILVHHAMNASFAHGLTVVNMLRTEASVLAENQFYA